MTFVCRQHASPRWKLHYCPISALRLSRPMRRFPDSPVAIFIFKRTPHGLLILTTLTSGELSKPSDEQLCGWPGTFIGTRAM